MKNQIFLVLALAITQLISAQNVALVRQDGKFGFIKDDGSWQIKPEYIKAASFSDGYAAVFNGEKWGYIDSNNTLVIEYKYLRAKAFDSGIAVVSPEKNIWHYINNKGKKITMPSSEKVFDFNDGIAYIKRSGLTGLINANGKVVLEPKYQKILAFRNGYAKVKLNESWGLIDKTGKIVIETKYQGLGRIYSQGVIKAKNNDVHGLIINNEFKALDKVVKIWDFKDGEKLTHAMTQSKLVGFINRSGEWVVKPQFKKVKKFQNGFAPVSTTGKIWGYMNESGKIVIEERFRDAELFSKDGLAPVKLSKLWGFIDQTGKLIIKDQYIISVKSIGFGMFNKQEKGFINGLAKVNYKKKWGFITTKGEVLGDTWFQLVENFTSIK